MTKKDLVKKVAHLESLNDHLLTELSYVDRLMRLVGFVGGLETVKLTAKEYEWDEETGEFTDLLREEWSFIPSSGKGFLC